MDQGIEHYKLNEDESIKKFKEIVTAQLNTDNEKMMKKCTMPYEMAAEMKREGAVLGTPAVKANESLTF